MKVVSDISLKGPAINAIFFLKPIPSMNTERRTRALLPTHWHSNTPYDNSKPCCIIKKYCENNILNKGF